MCVCFLSGTLAFGRGFFYGGVTQLAEYRIVYPAVAGSNPAVLA